MGRAVQPARPGATLIARPYIEVGTRRLAPGNAAFFACLGSSSSIGEVVEGWRCRVRSVQAPADALATLIGANIAVGIEA